MDAVDRLKIAIESIKNEENLANPDKEKLTNEAIATKLWYEATNYVSDILSRSKKITKLFLKRLQREYSISAEWILTGKGEMLIPAAQRTGPRETSSSYRTETPKIKLNTPDGILLLDPENKDQRLLLNTLIADREKYLKDAELRAEKAEHEKVALDLLKETLERLVVMANRIDINLNLLKADLDALKNQQSGGTSE
ncbi:hypothetical protein [Longitalea luteola]|uniref:hypothetical protein n=1 Tax=Longitalea luteola TaxID=2812563 RepID=UPI001A970931|nr:hypothetical protein [Longitalea luteola]